MLILFSFNFAAWCLRFLQIFSTSAILGPKLIMIRHMLTDLLQILSYLFLICISYAVTVYAIMRTTKSLFYENISNHDDNISHTLHSPIPKYDVILSRFSNASSVDVILFLDDLLVQPLSHLFGEFEDFDEVKNIKEIDDDYKYKIFVLKFLGPFLRFVFMLFTVILLLNLMVAVFNKSIERVSEKTNEIWNRYRKSVILEYYGKSRMPIPFSIITEVIFLIHLATSKWCPISIYDHGSKMLQKLRYSHLNGHKGESKADETHVDEWFEFVSRWEKSVQDRKEEEDGAKKCPKENSFDIRDAIQKIQCQNAEIQNQLYNLLTNKREHSSA